MFNYSFKPDFGKKLQLFKKYGFDYIHWCDDWNNDVFYKPKDIKFYTQLVESLGLKCLDVHGTATESIRIDAEEPDALNMYIKLLKNRIEFCATIGGDAVVIHPPNDNNGSEQLQQKLDRSLKVFECVRPLCEANNVTLAIENCYPSDEKILKHYFKKYPQDFVCFCFDSGHANLNKNLDTLLKFGDRLTVLHLHDNKGEKDDHQPPFWGTINWQKVMQWILKSSYSKPINFEITHSSKLFDGSIEDFMEYSVRSIRKLIQENWRAKQPEI
jgi:sugar phosphate isomerase/epimerase